MERKILDVSQVNAYAKSLLESDAMLHDICVRGELSNYKIYPSGHHYFTLKDASGSMKGVMFKYTAATLRFRPEDGMKVLASGKITIYERDGSYQINCTEMIPDGVGDLHVAFEQLKQKLSQEGLFDATHKKPMPQYPHRIAIITSGAGAALHDMLRILGKRYPLAKVIVLPVRVQGVEAPPEICGAIRYANRFKIADVIITGRGGGSIEDLWAFNDERVAREIYASEIPVISAVGHEPDVTISDYVADLRAATPSNAAELIAPDQTELRQMLRAMSGRMQSAVVQTVKSDRQKLDAIREKRVLQSPENYLADRRQYLDTLQKYLASAGSSVVAEKRKEFVRLTAALDAMSPLKVLGRGYSVAKDARGNVLRSVKTLNTGDMLHLEMSDGIAHTVVDHVEVKAHE